MTHRDGEMAVEEGEVPLPTAVYICVGMYVPSKVNSRKTMNWNKCLDILKDILQLCSDNNVLC